MTRKHIDAAMKETEPRRQAIRKFWLHVRNVIVADSPMTPQRFREIRKHLGWTQAETAVFTGKSRDSIVRYETGETAVDAPAARLLIFYWITQIEANPSKHPDWEFKLDSHGFPPTYGGKKQEQHLTQE